MREIKFRAWAICGNDKYGMNYGVRCIDGDFIDQLMQYTGLKDKNGVDIYEGDILDVCNGSINGNEWKDKPFIVEWFPNKGWSLHLWMWDKNGDVNMDYTHWSKVIGNIYENPELLKANDELI
jgi:hypothetical protein